MGIVSEARKELTEHIIPFWDKLRDDKNGGFYGFMDYDTEEDFRKTLKDYLKDKDCEIEEDFITEIIKHMPFKSWEF